MNNRVILRVYTMRIFAKIKRRTPKSPSFLCHMIPFYQQKLQPLKPIPVK